MTHIMIGMNSFFLRYPFFLSRLNYSAYILSFLPFVATLDNSAKIRA